MNEVLSIFIDEDSGIFGRLSFRIVFVLYRYVEMLSEICNEWVVIFFNSFER